MQIDDKLLKKIALIVGGAVLLGWLLNHFDLVGTILSTIWGLLFPFVLGYIFAFLLNLPMRAIEKVLFRGRGGRLRRPVSFVLTLVLVLGILALIVFLVVPQLVQTVGLLVNAMPGYVRQLQASIEPYLEYLPQLEGWLKGLNLDWQNLVSQLTSLIQNGAGNLLNSAVGVATSIVNGFVSFFIAIIFACYLLLDKEHLVAQLQGLLKAYLPEKRYTGLCRIATLTHYNYATFVSSQFIEALVLAVLYSVILAVGGFQYPLLIGVFIGFTSLMPMIGAWLGGIFGAFILIMSMGLWRAVAFIIIMVIVQQIDGNLIYPHIVGHSMGLPAVWILVAVMVGGGLAGIFGMMFFIPLFSVLYTLLHEDATKRLAKKGIASPVTELERKPKKPKKRRRGPQPAQPAPPAAKAGDDGETPAGGANGESHDMNE